jgi:hypothetical protein
MVEKFIDGLQVILTGPIVAAKVFGVDMDALQRDGHYTTKDGSKASLQRDSDGYSVRIELSDRGKDAAGAAKDRWGILS